MSEPFRRRSTGRGGAGEVSSGETVGRDSRHIGQGPGTARGKANWPGQRDSDTTAECVAIVGNHCLTVK